MAHERSHYIADTLTGDEYTVLDCLVTAQQDNETPISAEDLERFYELLSDVKEVHAALISLQQKLLIAHWPKQGWSPTPHGVDVAMFREKTRIERSL